VAKKEAEKDLRNTRNVVNMVAQGDKKVEKQLRASVEHLQLHGAASLERAAAANDEREIVCAQLGVRIRRVGVRVSCRSQNRACLDA
jgi:hypothetical protein